MTSYLVKGGNKLSGRVNISGSKNAALGVLAAAMAVDGPSVIENIPQVIDISLLLDIFRDLGAEVEMVGEDAVRIDPRTVTSSEALLESVRKLRGSYYLLGAFLGRFGKVRMYLPGGCDLGSRPIDLHIKGFESLGATFTMEENGVVSLEAKELKGASIFLDQVSVGATINIMLAAVHAKGMTVIDNAAREPHIVDVANFLNSAGANIRGAGTDVIRIEGSPHLAADMTYAIIPDQIETGTYMMMAPLTGGDITVENVIPTHLEPLSAKLREMGVTVEEGGDTIRCYMEPGAKLKATSFKTLPYPGFPTDLQPQAVVLLCGAEGTGRMIESIYENRFQYIDNLRRMGANIICSGKLAVVQGGNPLMGAPVEARDLRAGAAMVMAGLIAKGETKVQNVYPIQRGYENFVRKMRSLGADISVEGPEAVRPAW
ncbi:MAG: UDP-N-acetylglucosamine 1-carboxyvinyltransferase [Eubacteriales bacterium]|nr:UDP-N-acetylglucosamine 1-carboxyvinyltransferase [Eubacteriales bacterium]